MIWLLSCLLNLHASEITPERVLQSIENHYPLIRQAELKAESERQNIRSKRGLLDAKIKMEGDSRFDGYYNGDAYSAKLMKGFTFLNSEVYGRYKLSRGGFPSYEGKVETLDDGEYSVGLKVSLLRDRVMNDPAFAIAQSQAKYDQSQNDVKIKLNEAKFKGLLTYWEWITMGEVEKIYAELLETAQKRDVALQKRARRGALAKIRVTENQQYIMERQSQVFKAREKYLKVAQKFSLFYRNEEGSPLVPARDDLPAIKWEIKERKDPNEANLWDNPEFNNLKISELMIDQTIERVSNFVLPKLDFRIETTRDRGLGPKRLQETEHRAMVVLEIPLEYNKGQGALKREKLRKQAIEQQIKFTREQIQTLSQQVKVELSTSFNVLENAKSESELARKMLKAEEALFRQGNSDFFVLNMREQKLASAQIKQVLAYLTYQRALLQLRSLYWAL